VAVTAGIVDISRSDQTNQTRGADSVLPVDVEDKDLKARICHLSLVWMEKAIGEN
jgi:hypothetical protein